IPVEFALERGRYESERHLDEELVVAPARFEQQDGDFRIGAEPVGEHATRRPRADNNVIVMHRPCPSPRVAAEEGTGTASFTSSVLHRAVLLVADGRARRRVDAAIDAGHAVRT